MRTPCINERPAKEGLSHVFIVVGLRATATLAWSWNMYYNDWGSAQTLKAERMDTTTNCGLDLEPARCVWAPLASSERSDWSLPHMGFTRNLSTDLSSESMIGAELGSPWSLNALQHPIASD